MSSVGGVNYVFIYKISVHVCVQRFRVWLACHACCHNLHYFISSECLISSTVGKKNLKNVNFLTPIFSIMLNLAQNISCGNKQP